MVFEPDLEQCALNQMDILNLWKNDPGMNDALRSVRNTFILPKSLEIYKNFSMKYDVLYIHLNEIYTKFYDFLNKYYFDNEDLYILYNGNVSSLDKFGFSDESYPIFLIKYKDIYYWLELIEKKDFFSLIISDSNYHTVVDISNIDDYEHPEEYTVSIRTNK